MYTNQELIKLWGNAEKRKAFVDDYKAWGIWFTQPELDLTFYKYELPDGSKLIAMEYLSAIGSNGEPAVRHQHYLQSGKYFNPYHASGYEIYDRLKSIKEKLRKAPKTPRDENKGDLRNG